MNSHVRKSETRATTDFWACHQTLTGHESEISGTLLISTHVSDQKFSTKLIKNSRFWQKFFVRVTQICRNWKSGLDVLIFDFADQKCFTKKMAVFELTKKIHGLTIFSTSSLLFDFHWFSQKNKSLPKKIAKIAKIDTLLDPKIDPKSCPNRCYGPLLDWNKSRKSWVRL